MGAIVNGVALEGDTACCSVGEAIVDGVALEGVTVGGSVGEAVGAMVDGVAQKKETPPAAQLERQYERSLIEWCWKESPSAAQLEKQWERRS